MLLVFFLVTSSMDADKGLGRKLSPVDEQQEQRDMIEQERAQQGGGGEPGEGGMMPPDMSH